MKEFIDKLISRLEEKRKFLENTYLLSKKSYEVKKDAVARISELGGAIEIVNELAEEYTKKEHCWESCSSTEHCKECRRLGNSDIDYYENLDDWAEEYNNGWIPCSINKHNEIHVAEKMWVTMRNKESKYCFVRRLMWNGCLRRWEWDNGKQISDMWEVVAWKKLDIPAPYTEGE